MIERLTPDNLHLCLEGGVSFFAEGKLPGGFVPGEFLARVGGLIEDGRGIVLASFDVRGDKKVITGALAGVLAPSLFSGRLMATEVFWYVLPEYRGRSDALRLFAAFEEWAAEVNAKMICFIHLIALAPEKLEKLYRSRGYTPVEVCYLKEVQQ
jgi:GNAT superfamily N-acetyltransferase